MSSIWLCLYIHSDLFALKSVSQQLLLCLWPENTVIAHTSVNTRGCFSSGPNILFFFFFIVHWRKFIGKVTQVFQTDSSVVFCVNPPFFSLRPGRGQKNSWRWRLCLWMCGSAGKWEQEKQLGSWGRGDRRQPSVRSSGWDRITFPLVTWLSSEDGGKRKHKFLGHWFEEWTRLLQICSTILHFSLALFIQWSLLCSRH